MICNNRMIKAPFLFVVIAVLFMGCAGPPRSISSMYEILPEKPNGRSVSKRVLLVADNQLNHLYGDPFWLKNELFDKFIPVTIRPVQQDLFGQDILKWVLQYYGKKTPVIHLGDGTNMACIGEFESFCEIMDTAKKPWVMAPGNHDAYLMGNIHNLKKDWNNACLRAKGPMTKDRFVREYLNHLKKQNEDFGKYLDNHPEQGEWRDTVNTETFLQAVAWKIDEKKPFRSFVLQELNLCIKGSDLPVYAILMDSTQYENAPTIPPTLTSYSAGLSGSMLLDQMDIADKWLSHDTIGGRLTVLMVHHPYASLIESAGSTVDRFREKYRIPLYVSGHTHHGEYFVRGGDNGWLELNVGSIVDWPIEFRTLEVHEIINDPDNLVIRTPLSRIPDIWDNAVSPRKPQCNPEEWEVKETDAKDFYLALNYKYSLSPEKTQKDLLVALLETYSNLIKTVKSADDNTVWIEGCLNDQDVLKVIEEAEINKDIGGMTSLLISLDNFEKTRKVKDSLMHRDYRLWQAIWASKYDKMNGRKPVTTDPYIRFPKGVR